MYSVHGFFQVKVTDPVLGLIFDTGLMKNSVTKTGLDYLFYQIDGNETAGTFIVLDEKWGNMALGWGAAGPGQEYYTLEALATELSDTAYARKSITAAEATKVITFGNAKTNASTLRWGVYWEAPFVDSPVSITEIGIYDTYTTKGSADGLCAATSFAGISVTTAQRVDATYTLSVTQA